MSERDTARPPGTGIAPGSFAPRLVAWQRSHGRHDLPWQRSRDPYRVWVSEIMLQQTRVDTVLRYYEAFLQRFPDVRALAEAPLDAVLAQWSGLGYYRRARNLHACARQVCELHGGEFPRECEELERLAGIGRSTAAAIAAFCHSRREAILDANVQRVLGRAFSQPRPHDAASLRAMWQLAESLLPQRDIEAYTQGLMDLGATLCKPVAPDCPACPFAADCPGPPSESRSASPRRDGEAATTRPTRPNRRTREWVLLWALSEHPQPARIWLQRRDAHGIWPGLWCLPEHDDTAQALAQAAELGQVLEQREHPPVRHVLTHLDLLLRPLRVQLRTRPRVADAADRGAWFTLEDALRLGLPAPVRKLLLAQRA